MYHVSEHVANRAILVQDSILDTLDIDYCNCLAKILVGSLKKLSSVYVVSFSIFFTVKSLYT